MFDGYDWHGRRIEVREDRFSGGGGGASSYDRGGGAAGYAPRRGAYGGGGGFGGGRGGYGGGYSGGQHTGGGYDAYAVPPPPAPGGYPGYGGPVNVGYDGYYDNSAAYGTGNRIYFLTFFIFSFVCWLGHRISFLVLRVNPELSLIRIIFYYWLNSWDNWV